jgi:cytochrome c-type protein NapC
MSEASGGNFLLRCWRWLWQPSLHWPWLVFVAGGLVIGVVGSGITAGALIYTSSNAFCTSCHQIKIVPEWQASFHYVNNAGFRAGCADCHEPRDPVGMVLRKVQGFGEVWHQLLGTISTPEKFEAHRLELAQNVWAVMRADHSENCQGCHHVDQMNDPAMAVLATMHRTALANGQACIDCHKGVAHQAPDESAAASKP